MERLKDEKIIIGIDEVGRGPLAGPITLAAFVAPQSYRNKLIKILGGHIKDSKQFSPKRREEIYRNLLKLRNSSPRIFFCASHVPNTTIDKKGISHATRLGIKRCLKKFENWSIENSLKIENYELKIVLDGSLKAPQNYKDQRTIIGGDSVNIFIACASIIAKVRRDRLMCRLARQEPRYAFQIHKGYGTALHYRLLRQHGLSPFHRTSFCKGICKI